MYDLIRKALGLITITTALVMTILPVLMITTENEQRCFRTKNNPWILKETVTEHNGAVKINEATETELESLYGIGPVYARRIIEERQKNGPFYYPEDLEAVNGIGSHTVLKFRNMIDMSVKEGGN